MPTIPIYQQQIEARSQGIQQVDTGIVSRAANEFTVTAGHIAGRIQEADEALTASKKIADARNHWHDYSLKKKETAELGAPNYSADLMKDYDKFLGESLQNESNPRVRRILEQKLGVDFRSALFQDAATFESTQRMEKRRLDVTGVEEANRRTIAMHPDKYGYLMRETESAIRASGLPAVEREKAIVAAREAATETYVESLPAREQLKLFSGQESGFESAMPIVEKNEGGFVASDGASGEPAIYGINRKYHADAFNAAVAITNEEGEAAGKEYAKQFYKKEYWDAYGLDKYDGDVQAILFDGMVNHRTEFRNELLSAADEGATPDELLAMREDEYQRLGKSEKHAPSLGGWMNRLENLSTATQVTRNLSPEFIQKQRKKAIAVEQTTLKQDIAQVQDAAKLGIEVPSQTLDKMATDAAMLDMPEVADGLMRYKDVQQQTVDFAGKPIDEQRQMLERAREDVAGGNVSNTDVAAAFQGVFDEKIKMLKDDPWGYYAKRGIIEAPEQLDFGNPESIAVEMERRRIEVGEVSGLEGGKVTLPLITAQEIDQLKQSYETSNADQAGAIVTNLSSGLTAEEIQQVAAAIAPKDPKLAVAMSLPADIAMDMIAGDKTKGEVTAAKMRVAANEMLAGYITDPAQVEQVQSAIYAYYKKLALDAGDLAPEVDPDILERAVADIMGEPLTFNAGGGASKVFGYIDDNGQPVTATKLEDMFSALDDDMLKEIAGGELPITSDFQFVDAQDIKDKAVFRSAGDGVYTAFYPDLGAIYTKDGLPIEFNARQMETLLKQRGKPVSGNRNAGSNTPMYRMF